MTTTQTEITKAEADVRTVKQAWLQGKMEWAEYLPAVIAAERQLHNAWRQAYGTR